MSRLLICTSLSIGFFLTGCADRELGTDSNDPSNSSTEETLETSAGPTGDPTTDDSTTDDPTTEDPTADTTTGQPVGDGVWELRMPDFSPPITQTWYSCYAFNIPVTEAKHVTGFRPQVFDKHIHHYVVGVYDTPQAHDPSNSCSQWVDDMVWGWAPGGEELHLPDDVGIRVGDSGTVTFVVQIHYDNPLQEAFVDNSGFDVLYTNNLRPHEAGILRIGDILGINIPAGEPAHEHVSTCSSVVTQNGLKGDLNVIGTWLHAHEIGSKLWTEVYREGAMIGELGREDPFMFDYQTFRPQSAVIKPGDELKTHCVYDASDRDFTTYGGEATDDEMCINFLLYYPRDPDLVSCGLL
ncbi:MAG: hypothetical protein ACPG4T_15570 [Nannocystaceae bacterium]